MEVWRHETLDALLRRNQTERKVFEEIILTNARYQDQVEYLRQENTQLTVQNEKLRQENADLRSNSVSGSDSTTNELQKKLFGLQEEITNLLRKKGEHAQQIIDLRNTLELRDKAIQIKESLIEEQRSKIESLQNENSRIKEESREIKETSQVVHDEYAALHLTYQSVERVNRQLEIENQDIISRYIALKAERATKMNEENEQFMRLRREQTQKALQEAAREEVMIKLEDGPPMPCYSMVPSRLICKFDAHDGEVQAVQWSSSSKVLATGGADRKVKIWDYNQFSVSLRCQLSGSNMGITSIAIDSDDHLLLAASNDMSARVWTISDQRLRHTLTGHSDRVSSAKFFNGAQNVVTGSRDRTLKLWDLKKDCCMRTLFAGSSATDVIASDNSASNIVSSHFDKKIRFWDMRIDSMPTEILLANKITSLDLSSDRCYILCCVRDDTLKVIDVRANQVMSTFCNDGFRVGNDWTRAKFSSDGNHIVVGSADGSLFVWNTHQNKLEAKLKEFNSAVICTSWSPSGDCVASSDRERKVCLWGP
ncbi:autophagy-related protein 16-1 [Galendromus occidentalis]|uniref:Autophagy-related protein 16-1 n=1 Tax=Galendromus occidentalis TaxID=34638 RepID=A0AAJ6QML6_9ACAR|nr:autophagy-related protein 16-1 [Galendromus occidentalis]